jgi:hypothetical protein
MGCSARRLGFAARPAGQHRSPEQLEGVLPRAAQEAGDAPEDAQGLDRARGLDPAEVLRLPAELVEDPRTASFAAGSLPQMNIVGGPPGSCGSTMSEAPTELKALTKRTSSNSSCRRSMSDCSRLVKKPRTPLAGGFVGDRIRDVDHDLAREVLRVHGAQCGRRRGALDAQDHEVGPPPPRPSRHDAGLGCSVAQASSCVGSRVPRATS